MTNSMISPQPNYSGITIQITNPAMNVNGGVNQGVNKGVNQGVNSGVNPRINPCANQNCTCSQGVNTGVNNFGVNSDINYGVNNGVNPDGSSGVYGLSNGTDVRVYDYPYGTEYRTGYNTNPYQGSNSTYGNQIYRYDEQKNADSISENANRTNVSEASASDSVNNEKNSYYTRNISEEKDFSENNVKSEKFAEVRNDEKPSSYPPQYYLNNYNYINNPQGNSPRENNPMNNGYADTLQSGVQNIDDASQEPDLSKSQKIIEQLDIKAQEEQKADKNMKEKKIVALTDEYIKSLENYLNNPNQEIRLMASKEVLKRLDEDPDRYNDAALNALLNKMMQDPSKVIRVASLSAFASRLASGNDYTIKLLNDIQANPNSDKDDVLQAADILLKMSSDVEVKYVRDYSVPQQNTKSNKAEK